MTSTGESDTLSQPPANLTKTEKMSISTRYCVDNWCVDSPDGSMYDQETFQQYNHCDMTDDDLDFGNIDDVIDEVDDAVIEICQATDDPDACITDVAIGCSDPDADPITCANDIVEEDQENTELHNSTETEFDADHGWNCSCPCSNDEPTESGSNGDPHCKYNHGVHTERGLLYFARIQNYSPTHVFQYLFTFQSKPGNKNILNTMDNVTWFLQRIKALQMALDWKFKSVPNLFDSGATSRVLQFELATTF
jgi:hypothetical protein